MNIKQLHESDFDSVDFRIKKYQVDILDVLEYLESEYNRDSFTVEGAASYEKALKTAYDVLSSVELLQDASEELKEGVDADRVITLYTSMLEKGLADLKNAYFGGQITKERYIEILEKCAAALAEFDFEPAVTESTPNIVLESVDFDDNFKKQIQDLIGLYAEDKIEFITHKGRGVEIVYEINGQVPDKEKAHDEAVAILQKKGMPIESDLYFEQRNESKIMIDEKYFNELTESLNESMNAFKVAEQDIITYVKENPDCLDNLDDISDFLNNLSEEGVFTIDSVPEIITIADPENVTEAEATDFIELLLEFTTVEDTLMSMLYDRVNEFYDDTFEVDDDEFIDKKHIKAIRNLYCDDDDDSHCDYDDEF